ncbi:helix-turn-helix domain-containing protein [Geodermatophilus sp. DSM 44513]|uniref:helix-turn-helix domain-containing protein n=1 Tax=Geodermatophilus sp. DSM 44513 TaxID=1528104 RepID=UPI00127D07E5|nr:helix-turn-helix domain-containing protein [Geodermatophilus sp. DSM 44513]WNV74347.1 helix-turn-helix domain-containing protein [Geodermatophilus sp. DSM 44513]
MIDPDALRRLRADRGLSQRRLAAAIGVDPLTVKRLEDGADAGDLPLRVLERLSHVLGAPVGQLLRQDEGTDDGVDLTAAVGAALLAHGHTTMTTLAATRDATVDDVATAVSALGAPLSGAGLDVARHHDEVSLVSHVPTPHAVAAARPLTLAEARPLRRIHRGEDVRRKLSKPDREFILPALLRRGLVADDGAGPVCTPGVAASLDLRTR